MPLGGFDTTMTMAVVILIGAVVQDLLWRKVKNLYVIAALVAAFVFQGLQLGFSFNTVLSLVQSFGLALAIGVVLYAIRILGAGDIKIFAATAVLLPLNSIPHIYLYSLIWGAVFGVIRYLLSGKIMTLVLNIVSISNPVARNAMGMQAIPFTVAILLGTLTDWTLRKHGVQWP
jgi:Flp pilus assembly protein protease CpaA